MAPSAETTATRRAAVNDTSVVVALYCHYLEAMLRTDSLAWLPNQAVRPKPVRMLD